MGTEQLVKKIPLIKPDMPSFESLEGPFREVIESGKVTNFGKYLKEFEKESAEFFGVHVAAISSGTTALILTLQAIGLKPGQKVILPSFSFMATAQAVLYAGGIPVFAEVGADLTLSAADLENLLTIHSDVFAVVPVHMYGLPCRVDAIDRIIKTAEKQQGHPIRTIYDAAHAFGSSVNGTPVGNFGDAEVFSFSVTKALVSVEGGMVTSRNPELIQLVSKMRNYGIDNNYNTYWPGLNGKLSELHAIVGLMNLRNLPEILLTRAKKAAYFRAQVEEKTSFKCIPLPLNTGHTFKDFTVILPAGLKQKRSDIMRFLEEAGIETRAYFYPPIHEQKYFQRFADRPLPVTEDLSRRVITLPFFTSITESEMDFITVQLAEAERKF